MGGLRIDSKSSMDKMLVEEEKQFYLNYTNRNKVDSSSKRLQPATSGLQIDNTAFSKDNSLTIAGYISAEKNRS